MPNKTDPKHLIRRKIYFLVIAVVGVIGTLITLGIILQQILNKAIITDDEWIQSSRHSYLMTECSQGPYNEKTRSFDEIAPDKAETCKEEREAELLITRDIDYKEDLIGGLSRGILFLILMVTHLPAFLNTTRKE